MPKVFIVDGNYEYAAMFRRNAWEIVDSVEEADLVQFTGGEDVWPGMYGDNAHPASSFNVQRDMTELGVFNHAHSLGIPVAGICRGGQFLNVCCGGRMYQHVELHATGMGHHILDVKTGEHIYVSSTHHQMMLPGPNAELVATSRLGGKREWFTNEVYETDFSDEDIEVVFYKDMKALCFQPHPEFNKPEYERMTQYYFELIQYYFGLKA